jgi:hypothetical protein
MSMTASDAKALAYVERLSNTRPISVVEIEPRDAGQKVINEMQIILELINSNTKPGDVVFAETDAGDAEASIDYASRYV